jgi:hypothetical protein
MLSLGKYELSHSMSDCIQDELCSSHEYVMTAVEARTTCKQSVQLYREWQDLGKCIDIKCLFCFSLKLLSEISFIPINNARVPTQLPAEKHIDFHLMFVITVQSHSEYVNKY